MKIYSMTATFGKLEHETLTLQPGLNIIEAPNEWGKSTWCAFLVNMLYGLDTRAKSTKTALADKERYAPWSGAPMAGRIDLNWNGRDITIERRTRGRLIFGEFQAYETATGVDIPELNGLNCGPTLLGVERSVFERSGFIRLTDLPVTQDDALRRRLNSLVTTGDESGAGDKLQKTLKDLKNKCRYNRSGLLPQAEAQRDLLEDQLNELKELSQQTNALAARRQELEERVSLLENHKAALHYADAQADAQKVTDAARAKEDAQARYDRLQAECADLPPRDADQQALQAAQQLHQQLMSIQMETQMLPPLPEQPETPAHYKDLSPDAAVKQAAEDATALAALDRSRKKRNAVAYAVMGFAVMACIAAAVLYFGFAVIQPILFICLCAGAAMTGIGVLITLALCTKRYRTQTQILYNRHPGLSPDKWLSDAHTFAERQQAYRAELDSVTDLRGDLDKRLETLTAQIQSLTGGKPLGDCVRKWEQNLAAWAALADALRDLRQAEGLVSALQTMAKTAVPPKFPDKLTYSEPETDGFLNSATFELRQLQLRLGQFQGRAEALGQEAALRAQLQSVNRRIRKLEDTYAALELAQKALSAATTELQRRFAPRISKRAQSLFSTLTGGRYARLTLSEDLSLNTCTQSEDTLRTALWRSDGTVDQLYLALRLAVSEELTPEAPLILDDALVRFDDQRLSSAMDILGQTAQNKQVILFTCQGRETNYGKM